MKAILSDIHSNLEALQAVLDDIARYPVEAIYCLGDMIGYGPNPLECLDVCLGWPVVLLGNHDYAALFGPRGFTPTAERAIHWTRAQLEAATGPPERVLRRWEFLAERPRRHEEPGRLYVHGSPRHPLTEYIFPEDVYNLRKMRDIFGQVEGCCFQGHTHVPGIFVDSWQYFSPEELNYVYRLDSHKTLCNVGSVGQPRDGDWRACYVLLEGDTIYFRRVEYDIATTLRKIAAIPELGDPHLGD